MKKKIEIFEKALAAEKAVFDKAEKNKEQKEWKETFGHYKDSVYDEARKACAKLGCTSVKVLRAYRFQTEEGLMVLEDFWERETQEILETLETGKVKEFFITDQSTGLMRMLHGLAKGGWKFETAEIPDELAFEKGKKRIALKFTKK